MSNSPIIEDWFELPVETGIRAGIKQLCGAEIRVWTAGDGLSCGLASSQRLVACTAPVAVIRTEFTEPEYGRRSSRVIRRQRVVCARHVAEAVRSFTGDAGLHNNNSNSEVEKRARETVLAAHWDEYQAEIDRVRAEIQDLYLGMLPEVLREHF